MNVDLLLETMNRRGVAYLLIGGMNFLLRHAPTITFDVDLWIDDAEENRNRCEQALAELQAEWGAAEEDWGPVAEKTPGWLSRQSVFCLTSPHGAVDVFRHVQGLDDWQSARNRAVEERTGGGVAYLGLSDADMLRCQLALDEPQRNAGRIETLRAALECSDD